MTTVTTRAGKGTPLTNAEMDTNLTNLRDAVDNHVADTTDAHAATAIGFSSVGFAATDVKTAIDEAYSRGVTNLAVHVINLSAHDANAIDNVPAGNIAATDVQAALNELDSEKFPYTGGTISGYTSLGTGAPAVKMKKLTGTTGASQGDSTTIAHGLTGAKILGWQVVVEWGTNSGVPPEYTGAAGYNYTTYYDATNIYVVTKAANSSGILSKAIRILVTYE